MKVSFAKDGGPVSAVETQTAATPEAPGVEGTTTVAEAAPAEAARQLPAVREPQSALPTKAEAPWTDDDNIPTTDIVIPRINVVQKVGELSNQFTPGTIVLVASNAQLPLVEAPPPNALGKPLNVCVVGFQPTRFAEKVEGGLRGHIFNTEDEVVKAGGTLDYAESQRPAAGGGKAKTLYQRLATALLVVERPTGVSDDVAANYFIYDLGGKQCALALYSMKGTSYTNAAKLFKTARKIGHLRKDGYRAGWWTMSTFLKKFASNFAFIPIVKPLEPTSEKFRADLVDLLGF